MGFAVICPLARHCSLVSGSCSSARVFAPRFFRASPRDEWLFSPLRFAITSPLSGCEGDLHPQAVEHARHTYKMNVDSAGVTNLLKGRNCNEDLAGVISVWRDPADGKTYVVNGHHRFQLAKETGQPDVAVRMIAADDATEARAKGAIQNIAEGRGTAMDAAKFFRDSGHTPADLDRLGVSMG